MRVLVLGGNGFLGGPITRRLLACGVDVIVFHRGTGKATIDLPEAVHVIRGDRNELDRSAGEFRRLRPDIVVDVLAFTQQQAQSLMNTFRDIVQRVIVLSSGDVYRANDILFRRVEGDVEPTPLTESSPLRARLHPYRGVPVPAAYGVDWDDYDKILVERAMLGDGRLPATVLRLPMVYGPGDDDGRKRRFMSYAKRMDDGREAILLDQRTARWRAPWGYTDDIAEAVRLCVEHDRTAGETYNVGESDGLDTEGWVRELAAVTGWTGRLVLADQPCPPPNLPRHLDLDQHFGHGYDEDPSRSRLP
jgi:nucleoside-diphosphate-sugar epimerase